MDSLDVFEVLIRENSQMLTAYLRASITDQAAVDDLWQETMLTAWRRWDDYDRSRPFGAWLRGIAGKNLLAWKRRSAKAPVVCDEAALEHFEMMFSRVHQLSGDTFDDKLQALRDCIQRLPETYQEAIRLRYEDSLPLAELAQRQAVSLETVKKRLQRGKAMLLECIRQKLDLLTPPTTAASPA